MAFLVEVYGKRRNDSSKLLPEQIDDMADVFQKVCLGYDSDFVRGLVRQYGNKEVFRHINATSGMRYQFGIDHKKKRIAILSVDVDYKLIKKAA